MDLGPDPNLSCLGLESAKDQYIYYYTLTGLDWTGFYQLKWNMISPTPLWFLFLGYEIPNHMFPMGQGQSHMFTVHTFDQTWVIGHLQLAAWPEI